MSNQSTTVATGPSGTTQTTVTSGILPTVQTGASTGTGILGSLVGAAQTIYNIIKDHGLAIDFSTTATAVGASSGIKADDKRKSTPKGTFSISGVWYTHTRVFGTLLNRGQTPHEKAKVAKNFKSTYLCSVYPYEITWDLYELSTPQPEPIKKSAITAKELEFTQAEQELFDKFYQQIEEYKAGDVEAVTGTKVTGKGRKKVITDIISKFREKGARESDEDYIDFLKLLMVNDRYLESTIGVLEVGLENVKEQRADFSKLVDDALTASQTPVAPPELVFANIQLRPVSEVSGVKARFPQNIKVKAQFQINARQTAPWGFEVMLSWAESAIGYGYPGVPGSFRVTQTTDQPGGITITPNGKLGKRFNQFAVRQKIA